MGRAQGSNTVAVAALRRAATDVSRNAAATRAMSTAALRQDRHATRINHDVEAYVGSVLHSSKHSHGADHSHMWMVLQGELDKRKEAVAQSGSKFGFTPARRRALQGISAGLAITGVPAAFFPALVPFTVGALSLGAAGLVLDRAILAPASERVVKHHREQLLEKMLADFGSPFNRAAQALLSDQDWRDLAGDPSKMVAVGEKVLSSAPYALDVINAASEGWGRSDMLQRTRRKSSVRRGRLLKFIGLGTAKVHESNWRLERARTFVELERCAQLERRARTGRLPKSLAGVYASLARKTTPRAEDWAQYLSDKENGRFADELATAIASRRAEVLIVFCNNLKANAETFKP